MNGINNMIYRLCLLWISISRVSPRPPKLDKEGQARLNEYKRIIDLPMKTDLKTVLPVLHDILNFYLDSKNDIDLNLDYGIFLINVLLKDLYKEKAEQLSTALQFSLRQLLEKNDELIKFFRTQLAQDKDPQDLTVKSILTLYSNDSMWRSQIKPFDIKRKKKAPLIPSKKLMVKFTDLPMYENLCKNSTPTAHQADYCLRALARTPINGTAFHKCKLPPHCVKVLFKSSSVGPSLTHRLLILQFAHFGRRCYVESEQRDTKMENKLCKKAMSEANFLCENGYEHAEVIFEIMTFCALIGHFEVLKHSWLKQLYFLRTKDGCFADHRRHPEREKPKELLLSKDSWHLNKDDDTKLFGGLCEAEVTSGALTTMTLVVKYILEAYY